MIFEGASPDGGAPFSCPFMTGEQKCGSGHTGFPSSYDWNAEIRFQSYGGWGICGNFTAISARKAPVGRTLAAWWVLLERRRMTGEQKPRSGHKNPVFSYDWKEEIDIWSYGKLTYTPGGYMIAARIYTPGGYAYTRNTN